ncbi:MAG TPA: lipoprotein [Burkholderiaceae bacterium]|nr:lipoprotein [Burkholderiaceae bacterium]
MGAAAASATLAGCGQKGPLYVVGYPKNAVWPMPPQAPQTPQAPKAEAPPAVAPAPDAATPNDTPEPTK